MTKRQAQLNELINDEKRYTEAQRKRATDSISLAKAKAQAEQQLAKQKDEREAKEAKAAADAEKRAQKEIELANKKAEAIARAQKASEIKETFAAEEAAVKEIINLRLKEERIKQRLASSSVGDAERAVLQDQVQAIQDKINKSGEYTKRQIDAANASEKVKAAVDKTAQAQAKASDAAEKQARSIENMGNRLVSMFSTMVLMKGLKDLWNNATTYAAEYYDQMNEIQVVTQKSDSDIANLSNQYRQMAKEMSVSSKEIASAATTFYRQGLGDDEVEQRLKYTTQFAKVAAVDFTQAAELITATTNSMSNDIQGNIQRVVDVFVYLGDNAGTSGEEIAVAMQKSAAAAGQFGVSFEWLGAYIATVSETTRQAAEVVGTSLNSIIARMHAIRTTGYNSEDETKINDVAKALATVDIALLDQEGNWRDMTDIFNDIAEQWDTMDSKQQSYIATTLAGTKQQNTFLALMSDLSKGLEGGSRAWELYEGAMQSAGTVSEKYETWEKSVEAANGRLQASMEELYSTLWSAETSTWFKNLAAGFIDALAAGNQFLGGLGPIIAAIVTVGAVSKASGLGVIGLGKALTSVIAAHPVLMAVT